VGSTVVDRFPQVETIRLFEDRVDEEGGIAAVYLRYDARFYDYNRRVYSFMDLLGEVGGLQQALTLIGGFFL
jgi:hypothetical protein